MVARFRDRVVDLRRVRAGDLLPSPRNWRTHPPAQRAALRGVLAEIGYADALLVRETPDGLMLVDGHLRAETTPEAIVPVLVLDLDEAEADKLLLTLDPLAAMAGADADVLAALLATVATGDAAVQALLDGLAESAGLLATVGLTDPDAAPDVPEEPADEAGRSLGARQASAVVRRRYGRRRRGAADGWGESGLRFHVAAVWRGR